MATSKNSDTHHQHFYSMSHYQEDGGYYGGGEGGAENRSYNDFGGDDFEQHQPNP
jgi:hypothetical protein